jgi:hypothetical protein
LACQGTILAELQERRRTSSINALEEIEQCCPGDWYVRHAVWEGKRELREAAWEPLDPMTTKRVVQDRRQLLVRDEKELMEAALEDYQAELRGEGSRVMRLWNEPVHTPRPEERLSREISAELERVLKGRGISAKCEVKIRERQFTDIYVFGDHL